MRRTGLKRRSTLSRSTGRGAQRAHKEQLRTARRIERLRAQGAGALTAWEVRFVSKSDDGVAPRIRRYGCAWTRDEFADPQDPSGPLSLRHRRKVAEIERSVRRRRSRTERGPHEGDEER